MAEILKGSAPRDRPDIEVTTEMIKEGMRALYAYDNDPMFCPDEDRVERIFRAMMAAKGRVVVGSSDPLERTEA